MAQRIKVSKMVTLTFTNKQIKAIEDVLSNNGMYQPLEFAILKQTDSVIDILEKRVDYMKKFGYDTANERVVSPTLLATLKYIRRIKNIEGGTI